MKHFIPELEYRNIVKKIPIFCIDFLIRCDDQILLLKRNENPLKGYYWIIGGRLLFKEKIDEAAERIQKREIGRNFKNYKLIGFSNYTYKNSHNSRALHTPTLLYEVRVKEIFKPNLDSTHTNYKWSENLPVKIKNETQFINC
tara:strand:+ start:281 stop:709 length:429 start_codon:yes stop_codon:yes gene_type:complete